MPLPGRVARFNGRVTNRVAGPIAGRVPPFAVIAHRGRRSGHRYETPIWAFPREGRFVDALTYGTGVQWLANLRAAGGGSLLWCGRWIEIDAPDVIADRTRRLVPAWVRPPLAVLGVTEFVLLRPSPNAVPEVVARSSEL